MIDDQALAPLVSYLRTLPSVDESFGQGVRPDGQWWVKLRIDIKHPLAWRVVQELGYVLNYLSIEERLPTVFKPVSPPPYMNGGPEEFLSWVIECHDPAFSPAAVCDCLEGRLPRPAEDRSQWAVSE
jgi:hypothetical protein